MSRKGLIDAIVMGCIPIIFDEFQKSMYLSYVSRKEFEARTLFRLCNCNCCSPCAVRVLGHDGAVYAHLHAYAGFH